MIATNVRTLGAIVRQRRKALDWSQDRLAAAAGVSRPWLSAFEGGKASVEVGLVFAVLDALGMHVNVTSSGASQAGTARAATAAPKKSPTRNALSAGTRPGAAAGGSSSTRPPLTISGKSISSARARGATATQTAQPASSRGKKK
jgi:y4mF family transcriptional regulator